MGGARVRSGRIRVSPRVAHLHITVDDPLVVGRCSDNNTADRAGLPPGTLANDVFPGQALTLRCALCPTATPRKRTDTSGDRG